MASAAPKVGARVRVRDKDLLGNVAYVGLTEFAAGKWIGLVLDEPRGKNNGSVQGKEYFQCKDKHGEMGGTFQARWTLVDRVHHSS